MLLFCTSLLATSSALALAAQAAPPAQEAQAAPVADAATPEEEGDVIVVTGTRAEGRTRLDSASPVDVLSGASLQRQGTTELATALSAVAPSIDFPRPAANDGTDAIRPATLRGLSPDQTLVLINGIRGHTSALLNTNGTVGRGSAAVDLNTIPTVALDRIEVLRDGASAQYGSDAIAGVVNLRLREARSGGGAQVNYGFYNTDVDTANGRRSVTGENAVTASLWQGIGFGEDGFLTVSGEYLKRSPTNRADFDRRVTPNRITGRYGDPEVEQYTGFVNAGTSLTDDWSLYAFGGYQDRDTRSAAFPRLASATTALAGYPNGFLPIINTKVQDLNSAAGLRGNLGGFDVDLSFSYGRNKIGFRTLNSANYAYGSATPRDFSDGALIYDQYIVGLDATRRFDVFQSLNVAFGLEGRREGYKIQAGEQASYGYPPAGTVTGAAANAAPGAQGFGGFSPLNETERSRRNVSAYVDIEAQVTDKFLAGLAGRVEDYSDFGSTVNGKLSLRYDVADWFALRGTASTGFRAPSLQQQYFTQIAQVVQNGVPVQTGTYPSVSAVGTALGGLPLEPEKSTNLSVGTVIRSGGFDLTVDAYRIHIRNQIGLSENISAGTPGTATYNPQVAALLPADVSAARFFINGLATTTKGIDVVAHYRWRTAGAGAFDFTLAGNINDVKVTRVPTSTATLNPAPTLFARSRILTLEDGTPQQKVTGTVDWSLDRLGALARVTYYGNVNQAGTTPAADVFTGNRAITDLELRYAATKGAQIGLGVSNLFDVYPRETPLANNPSGVLGFPYYSPFGFNGRYLYARLGLNW
ncbi:TonB-dependent receptor plug domain-containing protein [Sphingomonas carotinifaciens]|uniref:Iron complex outermembrane recepter protein n=1 Tax=Sphingomonas carotinifaciens TaxID=1166323 RepID=A0A1G7RLI2_9SPHN|nr:iron complex outermembrane receptor protein [Sphingomonas carotinifaciens]SDG11666.1 iron complex outermembrane recepter protein [Sphingomonas carotinifaciens]